MDCPTLEKFDCKASAITKLINQGKMDLAQRTSNINETVLHYWASGVDCYCKYAMDHGISFQEVSLRVVKLLVENGADLLAVNSWGFTPLIEAAIGPYRGLPNLKVLDFLLEREEYSRAEKIEALELAGAAILQNMKHVLLFHKAFDYWRKAFHLRHMEVVGFGFIEKPRLNLKSTHAIEWKTSAELEDVIGHPDKFLVQSFLVRLRILSSKSWSALNCLILSDLVDYCFAELLHRLKSDDIFDITWAILETLLNRSDLDENKAARKLILSVIEKLIQTFSWLNAVSPDFLTERIIKTSIHLIASAAEFYEHVTRNLIVLVRKLSHLPRRLLSEDTLEILSKVRDKRGRNMLHEAIGAARCDTNLYATVRLLLCAGCDPNATDNNGNTPLHLLAQIDQQYLKSDLNIIAVLLLDFGAQLSRKNADGETTIDVMIKKTGIIRNKGAYQRIIGWNLPGWCTELSKLTCLSARVIRCSRIPYLELPATLIPVIEKHKMT